jgi:hypothetical protein
MESLAEFGSFYLFLLDGTRAPPRRRPGGGRGLALTQSMAMGGLALVCQMCPGAWMDLRIVTSIGASPPNP